MVKLGILATHPIQYHAPLFRELAGRDGVDLTVYFAHQPTPSEQGTGFGVDFVWDVDLLSGYRHQFLDNVARHPTWGFNGYDTPEIAAIIALQRFDYFIVHGWNNRSCWQAFNACWATGTPLAVRSDSQLPQVRMTLLQLLKQTIKRMIYPHFIRRFDLCLPYGQRSADYFHHYGARRVVIAHHFVDNDYFALQAGIYAPRRADLRRRWGIPADAFCFLFCGKFIAKKRPLDLLRALDLLVNALLSANDPLRNKKNKESSISESECSQRRLHVLMVGDGVLRLACEHFAKACDLPVSFAGFLNQAEINAAYSVGDCLVLPSDDGETWGLVVNEAMACGLPVIVTDACGCSPDLLRDCNKKYKCGDIYQLSKLMLDIVNLVSPNVAEEVKQEVTRFNVVLAANKIVEAVTN